MSDKKSLLASSLKIEPSQLYVKNLSKVGSFYKDIVGLEVLVKTDSHWILGQGQVPVLELISKPEFDNAPPRSAGLFHNAIVYSSRTELARAVLHIIQNAPQSYEGSGDHLVSEAFYFHDPENNGLELYYDRPRDSWEWSNGSIKMDTLYIDPQEYIIKYVQGETNKAKELGHVHLRVGDIPSARKFYVEQLGFDITADMGSALFVSVGGYHHHMAMNTWLSQGASKRDPSLGLAEVKLVLPDDGSIDKLANRLTAGELSFTQNHDSLQVSDPWGNSLLFSAQ